MKVTQISKNQVAAAGAGGQREQESLKELGVAGQRGQLFSHRGFCPECQSKSCFPPCERRGHICRSKNCLPALVGMAALSTGACSWWAIVCFWDRGVMCVIDDTHLVTSLQVILVARYNFTSRQDDTCPPRIWLILWAYTFNDDDRCSALDVVIPAALPPDRNPTGTSSAGERV